MTLAELNALDDATARAAFERCCGSRRWVEYMVAARPFGARHALDGAADGAERTMTRADWLEALTHHGRIGDLAALRTRFAATAAWAESEQAGVSGAPDATLEALAASNEAYERRFGHLFVVCATGLSAQAMLERLRARISNDPERELAIAAREQRKITRLRLDRLLVEATT